jgi:hypothetical protein
MIPSARLAVTLVLTVLAAACGTPVARVVVYALP